MLLNNALELIDLSLQAGFGIKGPNAIAWLSEQGIEVPSKPNEWLIHNNHFMLLRLGMNDFLIQDTMQNNNQHNSFIQKIENDLTTVMRDFSGIYYVPRADASLMLKGSGVPKLLSQICRLNTQQALQENALLMTQIAGIPAIIIIESHQPAIFRVWFDLSYLAYMTDTIRSLANTNLDFELV